MASSMQLVPGAYNGQRFFPVDLYRQTKSLTKKTLKIILTHHATITIYSALVLPIIASFYLGLSREFNKPNDQFGIGTPHNIFSPAEASTKARGGRDTVAFAGMRPRFPAKMALDFFAGAPLAAPPTATVRYVFYYSPDEGSGGIWNYTLRADAGLGIYSRNDRRENDAEVYTLPLRRAVAAAIARSSFPSKLQQYPYTQETGDERQARVLREYQKTFIDYLSVSFVIALIGTESSVDCQVKDSLRRPEAQATIGYDVNWRGSRTIIRTTHFLDEADLLADNIVILSRGKFELKGPLPSPKTTLVLVIGCMFSTPSNYMKHAPMMPSVRREEFFNMVTYVAPSSNLAAEVVRTLEHAHIPRQISGPTVEDVLLNLVDEVGGNEGMQWETGETAQ
ncbi:uncharacterized protein MAM_02655 [Metarhizium album ARSEF 1941]|uniref:Uncharacterized protein n=1 Tax=Metarhizium album (strain ARSEF 1941) TaxID=1081103 RepID=A0A0B2X264_METAS|nr:uncharacterized protein MAM_02655 [Metarhizium album ARSEF 1941]KHN99802.1 hypothetical protein MAM_02655 [Metarhizium album ARSEF 1941]